MGRKEKMKESERVAGEAGGGAPSRAACRATQTQFVPRHR